MSITLPFARCFQGPIEEDPDPPDPSGPQTIVSRNFGIGWGAINNQTGGMVSRSTVFNTEIRNYNFRILRVKYHWPWQETSASTASVPVYDWNTRLKADFDDLIAANNATGRSCRLTILVAMQASAEDPLQHSILDHVVPVDMQGNPAYDDGEWEYEKGNSPGEFGYRIKLQNTATLNRFIRYITAMLNYIKSVPAYYALFEGIGVTESSIDGAQPGFVPNENVIFSNNRLLLSALRPVIPDKMIYGSYNGPARQLWTAMNFLPTIQGACWGPDVFPDQLNYFNQDTVPPITTKGHYTYYQEMSNIVKFLDVQPQDYKWTANPQQIAQQPTVGHHPTIQELYDFAVSLGCHYLIFYRDTAVDTLHGETQANYVRALNFMNINGSPQKTQIDGGMNTVAPSTYDP